MQAKKEQMQLRYYDVPQKEGVLALLGENWIREYGEGIDYLHFHNLLEIGICRDGEGEMIFDEEVMPYGPGIITVIPRRFPHTTNSRKGTKSFWEYLYLDPGTLLREILGENEIRASRALDLIGRNVIFGQGSDYDSLWSIVNAIMEEMRDRRRFYVEKVRGLLFSLLFEIARISELDGRLRVSNKIGVAQVQNALDYVDGHFQETVRISELADACSMSETHFRRLFNRYLNMTPVEYVNQVRILRACEMLRTSNDAMTRIAERCGFSSISAFDRNFRRIIGVTPYQWKKDPGNYERKLLEVNVSVQKGW